MSAPNPPKRPKVSEDDQKPPVEVSNPSPTSTPSRNPAPINSTSRRRTADQMMPPLEIQIPLPPPFCLPPAIVQSAAYQAAETGRMYHLSEMRPSPFTNYPLTPPMERFPGACWIPSPLTLPNADGVGGIMSRCHHLCTLAGGIGHAPLYGSNFLGQSQTPMAPPYDIRIDMKPVQPYFPRAGGLHTDPVYQDKLRDLQKYKEFMERSLNYYRVTEGAFTPTVRRLEAVLETVEKAELEAGSIPMETLVTCEKMLQRTMRSAYYQFVRPPFHFKLDDDDEMDDYEATFEDELEENFERLQDIIMNKMRIPPASSRRHLLEFRRPSNFARWSGATSTVAGGGSGRGRGHFGFPRWSPRVQEMMAMDLETDPAPVLAPEMETDEDLPIIVKEELKHLNRLRHKVDIKGKRDDGSVDLEITLLSPLAPKLAPLNITIPKGYPEEKIIVNLEGRGEDPSSTDLENEKEVCEFFKDVWDMICPVKKLFSLLMTWEGVLRRFGKMKPKTGRNLRDATGVPAAAAAATASNGAKGSSTGL